VGNQRQADGDRGGTEYLKHAGVHRIPDTALFEGKTYSLRRSSDGSDEYYHVIRHLTDRLIESSPDEETLLRRIQALSKQKRALAKHVAVNDESGDASLVRILHDQLHSFTTAVDSHLHELRGFHRWDRTLSMNEPQYHLAMLEIELINRIHAHQFQSCKRKYAFLPHCLRDLNANCQSAQRDIDYVCKGCSEECNINHVSKALRRNGVKPYIWMTANLSTLFRRVKKEGDSLGVLGIACVPELMRGMRMCMKHDIPVVGIPLDANRCSRWWGEFYLNSVNIERLENLLKD
jgi:hypothetical protein